MSSHDPAAEAAVCLSLISPPVLTTPPTPAMVEAFGARFEDFIRAGGTVTFREWCLMPEVVREAFIGARDRLLAGLLSK